MGLLLNANRLQRRLELQAPQAQVKSVLDSAWQLDLPYAYLCKQVSTESEASDESACVLNRLFTNSIKYAQ